MRYTIAALLVVSWGSLASSQTAIPEKLRPIVEAERAFSRMSVEKGTREAWLAFMAENAINFTPHPVNAREATLARPPLPGPPKTTLKWEPKAGDVSASGDLGYNTGPYWRTDESEQERPPRYGYFFSVWKRQADGSFKVAIDAGIETPPHPGSFGTTAFRSMVTETKPQPSSTEAGEREVIEHDRAFLRKAESDTAAAYLEALGPNGRMHRSGHAPYTERAAIQSFLRGKPLKMKGEPIDGDASPSGDLGYVYGSYTLFDAASPGTPSEKGYYVRV